MEAPSLLPSWGMPEEPKDMPEEPLGSLWEPQVILWELGTSGEPLGSLLRTSREPPGNLWEASGEPFGNPCGLGLWKALQLGKVCLCN